MTSIRWVVLVLALAVAPRVASPASPNLVEAPPSAPETIAQRRVFTIQSAILGETRRVFVALPRSWGSSDSSRTWPVIVVFDGEEPSATAVVTAATELSRNGLIPEAVIVGIENTDPYQGRLHDLTPPGLSVSGSTLNEGGDRFLDFIDRELLPALDRQFRTAAPRTLVGHSSGAILATYAAATRSTFRLVVALDPPAHLGDNWLAKKLVARAHARTEPLRYAAYGAQFGWPPAPWAEVTSAAPAFWKLHYEHLEHESHNSMPMLGAYLGLREVFADYSRIAAPEYPTTRILPYYDQLAAAYGAPLEAPRSVLRDVVEDLMMEGRGAAARQAYERLVRSYGPPGDSASLRDRIAEVERRPAPTETVESLLATPFPDSAAAQPLLGTWTGEEWASSDSHQPFTLDIQLENGRVVGKLTMHPEPGIDLVMPLQYLTRQADGFTYGFMNGMRPRGMLLYAVRRKGDRYEGTMRMGGVKVFHPEGDPPTFHVELRRQTRR